MNFEMILDNCCDQEAFQSWFWMNGNWGDQEDFQSWSWIVEVTKRLFNLDLDLWRPRGFSTSILTKGSQGTFQPQNRSCGDKGSFQSRTWWKVTNGLFNLETGVVVTKGLFNLNLDKRNEGAFQPRNRSCGDHEAFQPRSWW